MVTSLCLNNLREGKNLGDEADHGNVEGGTLGGRIISDKILL